jgi:branched-chain amino acid aminotransferase
MADPAPYHDRDGFIWFDGKLVPWREANIHVLTHGLHYASTVFEGERSYGGEIFKLRPHTDRLIASARMLDFEIPYSADEIDEACKATLKANKLIDGYVRPIAWRGSEMMGVAAQKSKIHLAVAAWNWGSYFDKAERLRGIRVALAQYRRPDPATIPAHAKASGLYMICTIEKHRAERQGYADAMMLDWRGYVAECTGANIFFVKEGELHTPLADCFLNGITRQTVIELAKRRGIRVHERRILPEELASFSECFIVGTAAEVTPVREIGPYQFKPGEICETLLADYMAEVQPKKKAAAE